MRYVYILGVFAGIATIVAGFTGSWATESNWSKPVLYLVIAAEISVIMGFGILMSKPI
jgi:hypothetical protein